MHIWHAQTINFRVYTPTECSPPSANGQLGPNELQLGWLLCTEVTDNYNNGGQFGPNNGGNGGQVNCGCGKMPPKVYSVL